MDRWITNIAGLGAIGVAFFPTKPPVCPADTRTCPVPEVRQLSAGQQAVGDIHLFFAAITFIALGLMALRFAKSARHLAARTRMSRIGHELGWAGPCDDQEPPKKRRNPVYRACGITILSCVLLAAASILLPASVKAHRPWLLSLRRSRSSPSDSPGSSRARRCCPHSRIRHNRLCHNRPQRGRALRPS